MFPNKLRLITHPNGCTSCRDRICATDVATLNSWLQKPLVQGSSCFIIQQSVPQPIPPRRPTGKDTSTPSTLGFSEVCPPARRLSGPHLLQNTPHKSRPCQGQPWAAPGSHPARHEPSRTAWLLPTCGPPDIAEGAIYRMNRTSRCFQVLIAGKKLHGPRHSYPDCWDAGQKPGCGGRSVREQTTFYPAELSVAILSLNKTRYRSPLPPTELLSLNGFCFFFLHR